MRLVCTIPKPDLQLRPSRRYYNAAFNMSKPPNAAAGTVVDARGQLQKMLFVEPDSRIGTTTQLEGFAPNVSPRPRQSPTSRGNIRLLAASGTNEPHGELARLRSVIKRLEDGRLNHASINRFIPPERNSLEVLELPEIDGDSSPEEVENMITHMIDYLLKWTDEKLVEGPATVFEDIRLINTCLQNIMDLPEEVISSFVVRSSLKTFRRRYETFVSIWALAIHRALIGKLLRTESQVKENPTALLEPAFTSLVSDIRTASSSYPLLVFLDTAHDSVPVLVSDDAAKDLLDRCARLHEVFQNSTYTSEQKQLWLLIWRGLKTAFAAFEQGGAPTSPTNIERDRKFFALPGVYREFKRLISSPDAANPRSIEDMVGKYCRYIYECQVDPGNKYESLQRPRDAPLERHTKEALREFIQTGKFETSTLSKIHFAVARFNEISGGPVKVRRWQHDVGYGEWETVALNLPSPPLPQTAERRASYSNVPSSARSRSSFVGVDSGESFGDVAQKPHKRLFPYPEGVNMKSAFDYVFYPFPETRAHEVVQHEQISREMGQPGMVSEGPRVEFLINRPPRHARDPDDLSAPNRTLSPFEWIRVAIQRLFPQRRHVPNAKHPKINPLPSRRSQKISALKPPPLPIDSKARVHKSTSAATPNLKLRGGGLPSSRPAASSYRKRAFDPLAYRRMMMEIFRREIQNKYGRSVRFDEDEMLRLLKQTSYDVGMALQLYPISTRDKNIGSAGDTATAPRRYLRSGGITSSQAARQMNQYQKLFGRTSVDNNAEIYAYRMDSPAQPISGIFEDLPPGEYGGGDDDDQNHGHQQALPRQVLGELPVGEETHDDGGSDNTTRHSSNQENHVPGPCQPSQSPQSPQSPRNNSNQENRTPRPPPPPPPSQTPHGTPTPEPVHSQCHPCPTYEGQYHHVCRCTHIIRSSAPSPIDIYEDENPVDEPNQSSNPPSNREGQHSEASDADQATDDDNPSPPGSHRRPKREEPRPDDDRFVREVFAKGFESKFRDLGTGVHEVATDMHALPPNWITDTASRKRLGSKIDDLAKEIMKLRNQYLDLLEKGAPMPFMEAVTRADRRLPNPDVPATIKRCNRAAADVKQQYERLYRFFEEKHPRPNLGFRHQFNRVIRAVSELRLLFLEYDGTGTDRNMAGRQDQQGQGSGTRGQEDNQEEHSDDTHSDSEDTLSSGERQRLAGNRPPPKRYAIVPTRADYELMFVDELARELRNRGFPDLNQVLGRRYNKDDLINKLMALDREGNQLGHGADEGYRHITGDLTSRCRPRGWDLEDALKVYYLNQRNTRVLAQRARQEARRQARIARGVQSPAPVMPRAQPNPLPLAVPRPTTHVASPKILYQNSEDSDTPSKDLRRK
ncbi:hypothetical protein CLAIMM_05224 [Cladophialophora immunda]|nr:hypothetical protein CLAIMM_05224 [Cladophialophora immunda]